MSEQLEETKPFNPELYIKNIYNQFVEANNVRPEDIQSIVVSKDLYNKLVSFVDTTPPTNRAITRRWIGKWIIVDFSMHNFDVIIKTKPCEIVVDVEFD